MKGSYLKMKKNNENTKAEKKQKHYDKGQIFIKVMAGILAILMLSATIGTLLFALI